MICFFAATSLKRALKYDDSLDAFGVHAVGGIVALLTGIFAAPSLGGFGSVEDIGAQFFVQFKGVAFTVVYTAVVTFVILKVLDLVMGLRVTEEEKRSASTWRCTTSAATTCNTCRRPAFRRASVCLPRSPSPNAMPLRVESPGRFPRLPRPLRNRSFSDCRRTAQPSAFTGLSLTLFAFQMPR